MNVISCRTMAGMLFDFVEKSLLVEHRELVEEHLANCSQCRSFEESYRTVVHLVRQLPHVALPQGLLEHLQTVALGPGSQAQGPF
jgi:predicted anti-sigma-YlaC factor YlaD